MQRAFGVILTALCVWACTFPNDLDYPIVKGEILSFEVEDSKSVRIDQENRAVYVELEETANPSRLKYTCTLSEGASCEELEAGYIDLSSPLDVTVKTYQEYPWHIEASQEIERYVHCGNQIQDARFNLETKTVFIYLSEIQPLSKVNFEDMKLEAKGSRILSTTGYESSTQHLTLETRAVSFPMVLDCVMERTFEVEYMEDVITWRLKALQIKLATIITEVDPACYSARIRGTFEGDAAGLSLEYRKAGADDWTKVTDITVAGVGVTATVEGLEPETEYVCRLGMDGEYSEEVHFTTLKAAQLDGMDFDVWHQDGKVWNPWPSGGTQVWDTANKATASFTGSISTPDDSFVAVSGDGKKSCKLESSYAVVKFAAASIFTGQFVKLQGLGAELAWGIPFSSKPRALEGYAAYDPKPITDTDSKYADLKGQNDTGHIIVILTDRDSQFHVLSASGKFVDFEADPAIIAYGKYSLSEKTDGFVHFELPLEYRSNRTPKWVVVVASSSALGDYFTGGRGSTLWIDEFKFLYK